LYKIVEKDVKYRKSLNLKIARYLNRRTQWLQNIDNGLDNAQKNRNFKKKPKFEFIKRQHLNAARQETRQDLYLDILEFHGIALVWPTFKWPNNNSAFE
jgi:hypothetical protein